MCTSSLPPSVGLNSVVDAIAVVRTKEVLCLGSTHYGERTICKACKGLSDTQQIKKTLAFYLVQSCPFCLDLLLLYLEIAVPVGVWLSSALEQCVHLHLGQATMFSCTCWTSKR